MANKTNKQEAATLELWRAVEAGERDQVEAVLSRVADINARNEHGVTALMRAAQHGEARIVRLLLAHGADTNVARNDKFTALSLSAFFGHTEVVRILMEHGADSKASTRHGTSPHMWATARTFNEVVDQLKKPAPPRIEDRTVTAPKLPAPRPPLPAAPVVAPRPVTSAIARTLKYPPSVRRGLSFRLVTVGVLICASVVVVLVLRGAQARSEATMQPTAKDSSSPPVKLESEKKSVEESIVPPVVEAPAAAVTTEHFRSEPTQRRRSHSSVASFRESEGEPAEGPATSESVDRIQTPIEKTKTENEKTNVQAETSDVKVRSESTKRLNPNSPLSPQLITPAKSVSPKTKVIQWP